MTLFRRAYIGVGQHTGQHLLSAMTHTLPPNPAYMPLKAVFIYLTSDLPPTIANVFVIILHPKIVTAIRGYLY